MENKNIFIKKARAALPALLALTLLAAPLATHADDDWDTYEDDFEDWEEEEGWYGEEVPVQLGPSNEDLSSSTGRDIDLIESHLRELPDSEDELAEAGVVIARSSGVRNMSRWLTFAKTVASGEAASVDVASFTTEGDAVIHHIDYDGGSFVCVRDNTRDHYYLGSAYIVRTYSYLLGFNENGRSVLLTDYEDGSASEEDSWQAAVLASDAYESLSGVYSAISNDYEGESVPVVLFDTRG